MRVVAGSGNSRDFTQVEHDRHCEMVSRFAARMKDAGAASGTLTLILRSASSCPAKAIVAMKDELLGAAIGAKAILAKLEPAEDLRELFASLSELAPRGQSGELIRWARNPCLLDAHEQVTYGDIMCWSGDPMRRDADKRNALAMFDEGSSVKSQAQPARVRCAMGRLVRRAGTPVAWPDDAEALGRLSVFAGDPGHGAPTEPPGLATRPPLEPQKPRPGYGFLASV